MLGPSGSGKTTTLRMIAGFELPTAGTILLHGEDVTTVPPFDRDVNTVFQDYALFPHMTVGDNVAYGLMVRKVPKAERAAQVTEALRMVRLEGYEGRKPGQLSGGQRQRVALARALVNRPRVLLLDEPLGALDLKLREEMQIELKAIQQQVGITFIYVTHDQDEALTMSDRLAVFNQGRIEQIGAPADVYEHPATRFVAGFVGTSNLLTGDAAQAILGQRGTFTIRPEKIRLAEPDAPVGRRRDLGGRHHPRRGLPGPGHALHRRAGRRRAARGHPTEPGDDLERGARPARQGCPPHLEATARTPRRGRGGRYGGGGEDSMRNRRIVGLLAAGALLAAACSSGSGGSPAPSAQAELGAGEGALNLVIWAGYAERGATYPEFDWVTAVRGEDRLHGQDDRHDRQRTTACRSCSPATTTAARSPATRRPG